jgi:hypothetical protein
MHFNILLYNPVNAILVCVEIINIFTNKVCKITKNKYEILPRSKT